MKAAVLWKVREPMVVEDVELEDPKEGEVLVRLAASGVCHSCLHAADGTWDSLDEVNEAHRALAAGENMRGLLVF